MKNVWIIANWKSNKNISEALDWISYVGPKLERREDIKVVVCPPFIDVEEVKKAVVVGNYPILVGVQDLSQFDSGPYTGEESARILKEVVDLAILGHSERRQNFGETDEIVAQKVKQSLENNIIPLVCVQSDSTVVPTQSKLVAFEPIFAIGSGQPDNPADANLVAGKLKTKYGQDLEVLYGGSVDKDNVKAFCSQDSLNGVLIGQSSLDPEEFMEIINEVS